MNQLENTSIQYEPILKNIEFGVALKALPTEGNLVYEYNPFRNYRVTKISYLYKNRLWSPKDLLIELGVQRVPKTAQGTETISIEEGTDEQCLYYIKNLENLKTGWKTIVPGSENEPVLVEPGELTDFETDELKFDLSNPVEILPQYSYDGSVNLIINDGKNVPRLINSRFSATERNKYQIIDRKGNNDTNIYDQGAQFDIDTSLYKRVIEIPKLRFVGLNSGGKLPIGNYHFYFRYLDADGNETDFVAESGLVSIFIGSDPYSARTGFREEDSHKSVQFLLTNVDSAYQYVSVYYTVSTSDIQQNATTKAVKIEQKFLVNNFNKCEIIITGYEDTTGIPLEDINPFYNIVDSACTQVSCQNMLFLGNVKKPNIPYKDLEDLSLRFLPKLNASDYDLKIDQNYNIVSSSMGYYDPKYIYNKVGYWNHELYRFGIVYIMSDNSLTPVFNIRGVSKLNENTECTHIDLFKNGERNYIVVEEDTYNIVTESNDISPLELENAKGVVSLNYEVGDGTQKVYGIDIKVDNDTLDYLKNNLKIKGFFFVRQKRIPTTLCQAYTIGIDKQNNTPVLPIYEGYVAERFINNDKILTHDFESRKYKITDKDKVRTEAAICPDYDVDYPFFNSLFTGDTFTIQESDIQPSFPYLDNNNGRNFVLRDSYNKSEDTNLYNAKIIGVEDNVKLVAINDNMFSARAGEAEEAFRYEYIEKENKTEEATNLLRGSFGPYLGITGYKYSGKLIDIKIPKFAEILEKDLFKIRYNDKASFYAISDRISLKDLDYWFKDDGNNKTLKTLYRGDCYICQFTHRVNRNFQDPSAPVNDKIVDPNCWKENYKVEDDVLKVEEFDKINLGDVNAIKLGMWVTLTIRSTKNLNIRTVDDSRVSETALTGHPRGFYPYFPMSLDGSYKTPEALCYNKGFEKSTSERWNFEIPDVPAIKNDFTNRILYSDINVNDAFKNGFRVFQGNHYRDYPKTYGSITKLVELEGNLICVFEHGVGIVPVNERAVAGEGSGGLVYINTSNVLPENPKIISKQFGSQWRDSVIKTPRGVYGVDTIGKKIWRTNGNEFECISDFRVQEFLNNNISLSERELEPIIGVRNVKTHYNAFKGDIMFTFYDNLYGFEEKVWNLCYNENLQQWITFYSWVPSYSENIYNQFFSFDRNTSKWITKLGISKYGNNFSDGITLKNNIINDSNWSSELYLSNRNITVNPDITYNITYEIIRDNYGNHKLFNQPVKTDRIDANTGLPIYEISLKSGVTYEQLCSEYYVRGTKGTELLTFERELRYKPNEYTHNSNGYTVGNKVYNSSNQGGWYLDEDTLVVLPDYESWVNNCIKSSNYPIYKDERGRRVNLSNDKKINGDKIVIYLNIRARITASYEGDIPLKEAYAKGVTDNISIDQGYYQSTVAIITKYNMQFLTTDFWKHGQAGIINIADKIYPTYWYGKQHPFEFEFIVADNPDRHKIFDSLEIISNKAAPESFHYEIIGECYDFAKDKENMYIRQEATKELYQYNGSDIIYNPDYEKLNSEHRLIANNSELFDKSTIFPLYYSRRDTINEIEDFYHQYSSKDHYGPEDKNFSSLSGSEIVRYENLDEYRIWNHAKAVDITKEGLLRGNMHYKEDKWNVQINPINIVQKNESRQDWEINGTSNPPIVYNLFPLPKDISNITQMEVPDSLNDFNVTTWGDITTLNKEVKMKDKYIKIRIRYSGNDLAIISAIRTLYSISYA